MKKHITNYATGDSIQFLNSAEESSGSVSHFIMTLAPGSDWAKRPVHYHRFQVETFKVLSGELGFKLNGKQMVLDKNSPKVVVNQKDLHAFWNMSKTRKATFEAEIYHPKQIEYAIRITYALSELGKVNKKNIPTNPLITAMLMYHLESYFRFIPWQVQRGLLRFFYGISSVFISEKSLKRLIS